MSTPLRLLIAEDSVQECWPKLWPADLPLIMVSRTVGEELAVERMRAGAHDYLSDPERLLERMWQTGVRVRVVPWLRGRWFELTAEPYYQDRDGICRLGAACGRY